MVCNLMLETYRDIELITDPTIIQAYHSWNSMRANLHSNGTLTMSGQYGRGYLGGGGGNDFGTDQGINVPKERRSKEEVL